MSTTARLTLSISGPLALLALITVPVQPQDQRVAVIRTTTRLVQLNVVVLDNHKGPVSDLSQADFQVFDNGREQKLSHFSISSTAPTNTRSMPSPLVITNRPEQPDERCPTATVISVDELVLQPNIYGQEASEGAKAPIESARMAVLKFLATIRPGEQVALYALRREGVVVIDDLTDDSAELIAAAQTIEAASLRLYGRRTARHTGATTAAARICTGSLQGRDFRPSLIICRARPLAKMLSGFRRVSLL